MWCNYFSIYFVFHRLQVESRVPVQHRRLYWIVLQITGKPAHSALMYQYSECHSAWSHRCIRELRLKADKVKAGDMTHDLYLCSVLVTPVKNIPCCQAAYCSVLIKISFRMQGSCKKNENSRPNSKMMYIRVIYSSIKQWNLYNKRLQ